MKFLILLLILIPTLAFGDTTAYFCNYPTWSDEGGLHESKEKMELADHFTAHRAVEDARAAAAVLQLHHLGRALL